MASEARDLTILELVARLRRAAATWFRNDDLLLLEELIRRYLEGRRLSVGYSITEDGDRLNVRAVLRNVHDMNELITALIERRDQAAGGTDAPVGGRAQVEEGTDAAERERLLPGRSPP